MPFVVKRFDGKFLWKSGFREAFVFDLMAARVYKLRNQATQECNRQCDCVVREVALVEVDSAEDR